MRDEQETEVRDQTPEVRQRRRGKRGAGERDSGVGEISEQWAVSGG